MRLKLKPKLHKERVLQHEMQYPLADLHVCECVGDFVCMCVCVFVQDLYIFNFRFYECNANTFSCMNKSNDLAASACRIHKRQ